MKQAGNIIVQEGDNVEVYCYVTAGIPDPTIIWRKVQGDDYNFTEGKLLNITNITRAQAGKYKCTANNTLLQLHLAGEVWVHAIRLGWSSKDAGM